MVRQTFAAAALVALGMSREPGCNGVDDPNGGTNAPCTRSSDCGGQLVCLEGVCRPTAGGQTDDDHDPSPADAGDGG